ncbi:hypothetical protein QBC38DRAFT_443951 [Podospora fimiseda]|uniref:Uncharacterized protein n=1 Tax=Podospora fimiseda TaxID=252190 RepID=A0AAN7BPI8_9PEZI|nr:hypothetical protein QBC38DRAFT_443951 [Podospora fimiseda]
MKLSCWPKLLTPSLPFCCQSNFTCTVEPFLLICDLPSRQQGSKSPSEKVANILTPNTSSSLCRRSIIFRQVIINALMGFRESGMRKFRGYQGACIKASRSQRHSSSQLQSHFQAELSSWRSRICSSTRYGHLMSASPIIASNMGIGSVSKVDTGADAPVSPPNPTTPSTSTGDTVKIPKMAETKGQMAEHLHVADEQIKYEDLLRVDLCKATFRLTTQSGPTKLETVDLWAPNPKATKAVNIVPKAVTDKSAGEGYKVESSPKPTPVVLQPVNLAKAHITGKIARKVRVPDGPSTTKEPAKETTRLNRKNSHIIQHYKVTYEPNSQIIVVPASETLLYVSPRELEQWEYTHPSPHLGEFLAKKEKDLKAKRKAPTERKR